MNPWIGIGISLMIVAFAFLIKHVVSEIAEDEHHFLWILALFFVFYAVAATSLSLYLPHISTETANAEVTLLEDEVRVRLDDARMP